MKNISSLQSAVLLLSLAAIANGIGALTAQAETVYNSTVNDRQTITESQISNQTENLISPVLETEPATAPKAIAISETDRQPEAAEKPEIKLEREPETKPIPGKNNTSASTLKERVAQFDNVEPGRPTRTGSSYIGIGGNIGLTGDQALGDFGVALFAKIGLTRDFSVRPTFIFSEDFDFLLPLTYDFRIESTILYPFLGGGLIVTTGDGNIGGLITGGVDIPLSSQFTATGRLNVGFTSDDAAIGFIFGLGYNFGSGFTF